MKKFAAVIAISVACTTTAFAQGYGYAPACPPPAPACAVQYGTPCIDPLAPVVGVVNGVGAFVSSTVNGFANLFGCNPC
jgi:hypothetical protein